MRISVKIGDIEVVVERPNFKESGTITQDPIVYREVVKPTLFDAVAKAKELYAVSNNLNIQNT